MIDKPFPINCVVRNLRQASWPANDTVIDRSKVFVSLDFRALLNADKTGVSVNNFIIRTYQLRSYRDVMCIGWSDFYGMNQPCSGIRSDRHFIPKRYSLPFFVWCISGSRFFSAFLVELGAFMIVASMIVPLFIM